MPSFPLLRLCVFVSGFTFFVSGALSAPLKQPNFVVILADGIGFSDCGSYGGDAVTPCLDWLAENGLRFSEAYHGGSLEETEDAILSGYHPAHLRKLRGTGSEGGGEMMGSGRRLPQILEAGGYRTYSFGRGGDGFLEGKRVGKGLGLGPAEVVDRVVASLKTHTADAAKSPFFCMVSLPKPELDSKEKAAGRARFEGRIAHGFEKLWVERSERFSDCGVGENAGFSAQPVSGALERLELKDWEQAVEERVAVVERLDASVARIVEQIVSLNLWENTVILFLSGSDWRFGQGGGGGDRSQGKRAVAALSASPLRWSEFGVHEGSLSAPCMVHWPGGIKARGEWRSQAVHPMDLAPTILRLAGLSWPKTVGNQAILPSDGVDLSGVLRENRALAGRGFWWGDQGRRVFRLGDWKWVSVGGQPPELYYLRADRSERLNLAEANHERITEMESQWKRMEERFNRDLGAPSAVGVGSGNGVPAPPVR